MSVSLLKSPFLASRRWQKEDELAAGSSQAEQLKQYVTALWEQQPALMFQLMSHILETAPAPDNAVVAR